MKKIILALPLIVAACAQSPGSIQPVSMTGTYDHIPCATARERLASERTNLGALERQQQNAVTGDALGVFLIGVPVSSLSGGDRASDIAVSKGRVLALETRVGRC